MQKDAEAKRANDIEAAIAEERIRFKKEAEEKRAKEIAAAIEAERAKFA